jgi:acylphosphatase
MGIMVGITTALQRRRIVVQGIVQGVGFRPFVFGLASSLNLAGFVLNDSHGVTIEVEGGQGALETFQQALLDRPPRLPVSMKYLPNPSPRSMKLHLPLCTARLGLIDGY